MSRMPDWFEDWAENLETRLGAEMVDQADRIIAALAQHPTATGFRLLIGGKHMGRFTFTVDEQKVASIDWTDDHGDVATAPDGVTIVLVSSDPTILDNPVVGSPLVVHMAGTVTVTGTATDASGVPVPAFAPQTADCVITAGAATGFSIAINDAAPVPVP